MCYNITYFPELKVLQFTSVLVKKYQGIFRIDYINRLNYRFMGFFCRTK